MQINLRINTKCTSCFYFLPHKTFQIVKAIYDGIYCTVAFWTLRQFREANEWKYYFIFESIYILKLILVIFQNFNNIKIEDNQYVRISIYQYLSYTLI